MTAEYVSTEQLKDEFYERQAEESRERAAARSRETKLEVLEWSRMADQVIDHLEVPKENHAEVFCTLVQAFGTARLIEKLDDIADPLRELHRFA